VTISYAPQRVRGCDGGGWAQDTTLKFLDRSGRAIGQGAEGSGFGGTGMVPRSKPPLVLSALIPAGAVKVQVLTVNDGGPHRASDQADTPHSGDNKGSDQLCSDSVDGRGWQIDIGSAAPAPTTITPTPSTPPAATTLVPGIYEAKDTRNDKAIMTVRRADAHNLRYDITLTNTVDGQSTDVMVPNMWGADDGIGNGQFVTPALRDNDCEISVTVTNGVAKLSQGDSTCASQGFQRQQLVDGTYTLVKAGPPPGDALVWTGSFVEPSPGATELDISVQTAPQPGSSAFTFVYAYTLDGKPVINGIAKVGDRNQPATSTASGCPLTFEWLMNRMTVSANAELAACSNLGFQSEDNAFEILGPKP
jgi:hypothetical protein